MPSNPPSVIRMRRDLGGPLRAAVWPVSIHLTDFSPDAAAEVHDLLSLAYANGGGTVSPFEQWWNSLSTDAEFDPALCFVARDNDDRIAGVALCWTSAFVKDLAVHANWQRRGLGEALLLHTFEVFRTRGASAVDLKVRETNPTAIRLYTRVGMHVIEQTT